MVCDVVNQVWRCKLPGETEENPPPDYLGSCYITEVKSDNGKYYCPNESTICNENGSLYTDNICKCNENYYGDAFGFGQCKNKCPDGTFLYQGKQCEPILPCVNGTFSKLLNACVCNTGFYNKNNICKEIPSCNGRGIYNTLTEICDCVGGYSGDRCQHQCPSGQYYFNGNCTTRLVCENNGSFDEATRKCTCNGNWTGLICNVSRLTNCSNNGNPVLNEGGLFSRCDCDNSYYGPICKDTKATMCNGRGIPQYDSNGQFTHCVCDNPKDGGKRCQLTSADYCHSNGKVFTTSTDTFDRCQCDAGSTGDFCCLINQKISVTDACTEKEPLCLQGSGDNGYGWKRNYKTETEITNTNTGWPRSGTCTSKCSFNVTGSSGHDLLLTYTAPNQVGGPPTISCQKRCPNSIPAGSCTACPKKSGYTTGDSVCLCDSGTNPSYTYQCRQLQSNTQCGTNDITPQLCANGQMPTNKRCGTNCLWHCGGYAPSLTSSSDTYISRLRDCVILNNNPPIDNTATGYVGVWTKQTDPRVPVYPAINNEQCEKEVEASFIVNTFDQEQAAYYKLFNNPQSNIVGGVRVPRVGHDTNKYFLYNSKRMDPPTLMGKLSNILTSEPDQFNNGCLSATPNSFKEDYCNNRGTFTQTCYKADKTTKVACGTADAVYKLKEGTCACESGYAGNRCQYSNNNNCRNRGTVSATSTGTNAMVTYPGTDTVSCNCNTYSGYGGDKQYKGGQCQYSDSEQCNNNGSVSDTGTCSCDGNWNVDSTSCSTKSCGDGIRTSFGSCYCGPGYTIANFNRICLKGTKWTMTKNGIKIVLDFSGASTGTKTEGSVSRSFDYTSTWSPYIVRRIVFKESSSNEEYVMLFNDSNTYDMSYIQLRKMTNDDIQYNGANTRSYNSSPSKDGTYTRVFG
jgi:hypothetical protein